MNVVSRSEAIKLELPRYFTGVRCHRGHLAERKTKTSDCLECLRLRQENWRKQNADKENARSRAWYEANKDHAKKTRADWRARNAEKDKADIRSYQEKNRDRLRSAALEWQRNNPDKMRAKRQRYFENNRDRILKLASDWRKNNRGYVNSKKKRRGAIKRQAIPRWANFRAIRAVYKEAARLTELTGIQHHVDHIIPLQSPWVCGLHCEANLQILPYYENQSKSNRVWPDMPDLTGCSPLQIAA